MYSDKYYDISRLYERIGREIVKTTYVYLHVHKELQNEPKYKAAYLFVRRVEAEHHAAANDKTVDDDYLRNEDFILELWIKTHADMVDGYRRNADWLADNLEKIYRYE